MHFTPSKVDFTPRKIHFAPGKKKFPGRKVRQKRIYKREEQTPMSIPLLSYPTPTAFTAFTTTRPGGVSTEKYAEMNLSHYCGDAPEHVTENRRLLAEQLGLNTASLIVPRQVHGTEIRAIDSTYLSLAPEAQAAFLEGVDGLVTDLPRVCIGISTADCVPVLLYDVRRKAVAAVHAGWRGTVAGIAAKGVHTLAATYHSQPDDLHALIGPSISQEAFEVGEEVFQAFADAGFPMEKIAVKKEKWHLDLWAANCLQLEAEGLPLEHIAVSGICTFSHADTYFSARRLGISSGRLYSGIFRK